MVAFVNQTYAIPTAANFAALDTLIALAKLRPRGVMASPMLTRQKDKLAKLLPDWVGEQATIEVFFTLTPENPARVQQLDMQLVGR